MINGGKGNFITAHYDWLVVALGLVVLAAGGTYFGLMKASDETRDVKREITNSRSAGEGVKPVDMKEFEAALALARKPLTVNEFSAKTESFLASESRVKCRKCGKAIVADVKACPECPFCGEKQEVAAKVVLDADGDGLPDEWEKKHGLNPADASDADADKDGDGFSNAEEFAAKTDPTDPKDHPDYLDSLKIQLPLKEKKVPFVFRKASQIPGGWRCDFTDPSRKDDYGRAGRTISVKTGEKIVDANGKQKFDYGFTLKSYTAKTEKREKKGMKGMKVEIDVSEVEIVRDSDGKRVTLVIQPGKGAKLAPVDVAATLVFERRGTKTFEVTPGSEISLYNEKYRVKDVQAAGKGAKVALENAISGKARIIEALEQ